ncbi:MAG TPA: MbtH domain protein [Thermoanaerobaculia bacterium]|jgi:hypothetical protein|nr:MbtH domain protein [Thermoanaerobaculia bacterium]
MNELVQRLTQDQEIEASLRPEATVPAFKAAIDRGYVHAKFPNTRGGTELLIPLDRERSDVSGADFEKGTGQVKIVGQLVLDYTKVRFHGTIDLSTLKGIGRLEPLGDVEPGSASTA